MDLGFMKELFAIKIHKEKEIYVWLLKHALRVSASSYGEVLLGDQNGKHRIVATLGTHKRRGLEAFTFLLNHPVEPHGHLIVYKCGEMDDDTIEAIEAMIMFGLEKLEHLKTKQALRKSQRIFKLTFEQVGSGICQTDLQGVILDANQKFCDLIGYTREEAKGLSIKSLTHPEDYKIDQMHKRALLDRSTPHFSMEKRYLHKEGGFVWVYITVTFMSADAFNDDFLIGIVQDISKQKEAEAVLIQHNEALEVLVEKRTKELECVNKELEIASKKDPLTKLYNRRYLLEKLEEEINRFNRNGKLFTVVLMDIDYFKVVNDRYGHDCGDEMLVKFSELIFEEIRTLDILGRWGGEEFLLILPETDKSGAALLAERIRARIESYKFSYEENYFPMTLTFGVCEYGRGVPIKETIKRADRALYEGKSKGRNRVIVWEN